MSGYSVSSTFCLLQLLGRRSRFAYQWAQYSSSGQGNYSYQPPYQPGIPQYTQHQIHAYYAQYQCYPPEPWQMVQEYYVEQQPMSIPHTAYQEPVTGYESTGWQLQDTDVNVSASPGQKRCVCILSSLY